MTMCCGCDTNIIREDGFEQLHVHTSMGSILDGFGEPEEYALRAKEQNMKFLTITDHGMMSAIPRQMRAAEKMGLHPIYGCELYLNDMQRPGVFYKDLDPIQQKAFRKSYHLLAIAYNETGYKNLVKLSSYAWEHGFYYKPRVNYAVLNQYKEGIYFTSCCYNSEIGQAFERGGADEADQMIEWYMAMFPGNFWLEIMLLDFKKQKPYDIYIIRAAEKYRLPIIITNDVHYCNAADARVQQYMLMIQRKSTIADIEKKQGDGEEVFELQDTNLSYKSVREINQKWRTDYSDAIPPEILEQAKANTVKLAESCKGVKLDRSLKLPQIDNADEKFQTAVMEGFMALKLPITKEYVDRIKEEIELICRKGFSSYLLIQQKIINEARRIAPELMGWDCEDEAVGPLRGSSGGSLACCCLGITTMDSLKHDLMFSRFLNENRGSRDIKYKFNKSKVVFTKENSLVA